MKKKLVICDIDSTLVMKHKPLSDRAKHVIDYIRSKGILFGIASGRPIEDLRKIVDGWNFDSNKVDVYIGMNGGSLWDRFHQEEHEYFVMKREWLKETLDAMKPFDANPIIYEPGIVVTTRVDDMVRLSAESTKRDICFAENESRLWEKENGKIMFRISEEMMPKVEEYFAKHTNPNYNGFKTQPTLFEFCDKRINKGYALEKFCEMNDMSLEEVIAFGDTSNDNEMLKVAGTGVCMLNGSDDTKACADIITEKTCLEDGWADYMENHFYKEEGIE
jgi:Cof subfamily protein (haloacid dehalogenase superfamily)